MTNKTMKTKECTNCNNTFEKKYYTSLKSWEKRLFCSRDCKHKYAQVEIKCVSCETLFTVRKCHKNVLKNCSKECHSLDKSKRMTGRKITWGDKIGKTNAILMTGKKQSKETKKKIRIKTLERVKDGTHNFYIHGRCTAENKKSYAKEYNARNIENKRNYLRNRRAKQVINGGSHTEKDWVAIKEKYNYMCLCCKKYEPEIKITKDHIVPVSKGGSNDIENLQPLCLSCNSIKWARTIDYRFLSVSSLSNKININ